MTIHDKEYRYKKFDTCPGGLDLHALTSHYGVDEVAQRIGTSTRRLIDLRRGYTAPTVDDLDALLSAFPEFDSKATIARIAELRKANGRSRLKK